MKEAPADGARIRLTFYHDWLQPIELQARAGRWHMPDPFAPAPILAGLPLRIEPRPWSFLIVATDRSGEPELYRSKSLIKAIEPLDP